MTDTQIYALFAVLATGLGAIATAIKWGIGQIVETWKDNTKATIELSKGFATLSTEIKVVRDYVEKRSVPPVAKQPRAKTYPQGMQVYTGKDDKEEEP